MLTRADSHVDQPWLRAPPSASWVAHVETPTPGGQVQQSLPLPGREPSRVQDAESQHCSHLPCMIATQALHEAGQSLWLDTITRELLEQGTLRHYINDLAVTGLTSNPTIFEQAIRRGHAYDDSIRAGIERGLHGEALFFQLALEDLSSAAALFRPFFFN